MRVFGIAYDSIVDGTGLRYALFTQGCKHNCKGCHNPNSHDFSGGYEMSIDEIMEDIEDSGIDTIDGITLSGGDPFFQYEESTELAKRVKELGLTVWAYTGFQFEALLANENYKKMLEYVDYVVDGKFIEELKTAECLYRGSSNQRIIDVKASLESGETIEYKLK